MLEARLCRGASRTLAVMLSVMVAISSTTATAAIWDDHSLLICRGQKAVSCSISRADCLKRETEAVWRIDFRENRVTYLGGKLREDVLAKHVTTFQGRPLSESIFLSSGRVMRFHEIRNDPALGLMINATFTGPELTDAVEASTFQCSPDL